MFIWATFTVKYKTVFFFQWVIQTVNSQLTTVVRDSIGTLADQLWMTMDEEIALNECDIYR